MLFEFSFSVSNVYRYCHIFIDVSVKKNVRKSKKAEIGDTFTVNFGVDCSYQNTKFSLFKYLNSNLHEC